VAWQFPVPRRDRQRSLAGKRTLARRGDRRRPPPAETNQRGGLAG
jgi:hypothetical protein